MTRLPDFIIIGAMKCATSTLHEQLARQQGIFMSTPKEPCFFSDDEQWMRGIEWYGSLFATAPHDALCGESSTHYTKLPTYPHTIQRMQRELPQSTRFVYVMRHPIDRLVSQYIHEWTQRVISCDINDAVDEHPELIAYSRYAMQIKPFLDAFGPDRVLPVFFDRLSSDSQGELLRVCRFIGYQGNPQWDHEVREQNASSQRLRRSAWRDALVNMPGLREVRRRWVPQSTRDWIKSFWVMKQRPELTAANIARLRDIFDRDLETLGDWLGLRLCCDNFKAIATRCSPDWSHEKEAINA